MIENEEVDEVESEMTRIQMLETFPKYSKDEQLDFVKELLEKLNPFQVSHINDIMQEDGVKQFDPSLDILMNFYCKS